MWNAETRVCYALTVQPHAALLDLAAGIACRGGETGIDEDAASARGRGSLAERNADLAEVRRQTHRARAHGRIPRPHDLRHLVPWKSATMRRARSTLACLGWSVPASTCARKRLDLARVACVGEQRVVLPHQRVRDRHQLAEHLAGRFGRRRRSCRGSSTSSRRRPAPRAAASSSRSAAASP